MSRRPQQTRVTGSKERFTIHFSEKGGRAVAEGMQRGEVRSLQDILRVVADENAQPPQEGEER